MIKGHTPDSLPNNNQLVVFRMFSGTKRTGLEVERERTRLRADNFSFCANSANGSNTKRLLTV